LTNYEANTKQNKNEYPFLISAKGKRKGKMTHILSLKIFITPFSFHQIQPPIPVLNAELQGPLKTGIGIKTWPSIDGEMTPNIKCRIAVSAL